jgi:hypothetical protein
MDGRHPHVAHTSDVVYVNSGVGVGVIVTIEQSRGHGTPGLHLRIGFQQQAAALSMRTNTSQTPVVKGVGVVIGVDVTELVVSTTQKSGQGTPGRQLRVFVSK